MASPKEILQVAGREVAISNPQKVYFPDAGYTKLDVVRFYLAVADGALTGIRGRPMALKRFGYPELRRRPPGFETLLRAIAFQQISIHAAAAIWKRIEAAVMPLTAAAYCAVGDDVIRACGFSRQKLLYARSLAELVASGEVPLDALDRLDDEDAIEQLVKIKGVGRWTAEVYLMFALGRRDMSSVSRARMIRMTAPPTSVQPR